MSTVSDFGFAISLFCSHYPPPPPPPPPGGWKRLQSGTRLTDHRCSATLLETDSVWLPLVSDICTKQRLFLSSAVNAHFEIRTDVHAGCTWLIHRSKLHHTIHIYICNLEGIRYLLWWLIISIVTPDCYVEMIFYTLLTPFPDLGKICYFTLIFPNLRLKCTI